MSAATRTGIATRTADEFRSAVRAFESRIRGWTQREWEPRASSVIQLIQYLADAAAHLEGRSLRPVPNLGSVFALPDQFVVVAHDLDTAGPGIEVYSLAIQAIAAANG